MRVVIQRARRAEVMVEEESLASIKKGLVVLLGVKEGDGEAEARWLAEKTVNLRIFDDEEGKMNRSLLDIGGRILLISQFTLYADCRKGRRPSFSEAEKGERAEKLYTSFAAYCRQLGAQVETGKFGARMLVKIENEGPVTVIAETPRPSSL